MNEELRECPFCHGPASLWMPMATTERKTWEKNIPVNALNIRYVDHGPHCRGIWVYDAQYFVPRCMDPKCIGHHIDKKYKTAAEAIDAWNGVAPYGHV